jgi:hypothetical protein
MRKTILILAAITLFCSFKLTDNKPVVHPYQVVLTLDNWMYVTDYLLKQEQLLQRTSDLPSKVIATNNDTLEIIRGLVFNQLKPQQHYYDSLDAVKKDSITHKK